MQSSEQLDQLATAMAGFQADMGTVPKEREVDTGKYKYNYADLSDIIEAAKDHIKKHGLSVTQGVGFLIRETDGATIHTISTRVMHTSGQWIESEMVIPHLGDIRALGSSITYGRRYAWCAAMGIVSDMDDDGSLAVAAFGEEAAKRRQTSPPAGSTSTRGARAATTPDAGASEGETNGNGPAKMTAKNRNALVRHLAQLDPPVRGDDVIKKVRALLNISKPNDLKAITDLNAEQGRKLFDTLGIADIVRGGPRPEIGADAAE
jgi:hypothetical protein